MNEDQFHSWKHIEALAFSPDPKSRDQAAVKATRKTEEALVSVQQGMFSHQKVVGRRLEELTNALRMADESSTRLAKTGTALTIVIALAAIVQAAAAIAQALIMRSHP